MTEAEPTGASQSSGPVVGLVRFGATALAALVPISVLVLILRSSIFTRFDYFEMVPTVLGPDGSVIWSGLLVHQNEHLLAIPKLVYLANIWAFAGSNVTLGIFVWLIAGGIAIMLGLSLRSHLPTGGWNLPLVAWLFAAYLFPLQAQHNFRLAMSGTAWILANLFVVAAITLAVRDRPVSAAAAGGLATITYGTGLAVWPALGLVVLVRRRFGRGEGAIVAIGLASVALQRLTAESGRSALYDWSPISIGRSMAITLGSLFVDSTEIAVLVGLGLFALGVAAIVRLGVQAPGDGALVLVATMLYSLVGLALFGVTRSAFGEDSFTASRYMAFAALFVLVVSLLGLVAFGHSTGYRAFVATVAAASIFASSDTTRQFDVATDATNLSMVAVYMGGGVGVVPLYSAATDAALRASGHIPFHGGFDLDCGRFDERLETSRVSRSGGPTGSVGAPAIPTTRSAFLPVIEVAEVSVLEISGWVATADEIECLVITDFESRVTGIGLAVPLALDDRAGIPIGALSWSGYVERDSSGGEVLVKLRDDDHFYVIAQIPEQ